MTMRETVEFIFNYHDGPIEGVSGDSNRAHYFKVVFQEDIDEYSDAAQLMELDDTDRAEFWRLFHNARLVDPACWDPSRKAFASMIETKFDRLVEAKSPSILHAIANFRLLSLEGGAYAPFQVEWRTKA